MVVNHRLFQLLLHRSFKNPFVTADTVDLMHLYNVVFQRIGRSDFVGRSASKGSHRIREGCRFFCDLLKLSKVRMGKCLENLDQYDTPIFKDMIRTDGFAIDVMISKKASGTPLPDLKLSDIQSSREYYARHFRLWGIDPGIKGIFSATDGRDQFSRFSTKEWRFKYGTTRRQREQLRRLPANVNNIQTNIPSTKTSSSISYMVAARYILTNLNPLVEYYGKVDWSTEWMMAYCTRRKKYNDKDQYTTSGQRLRSRPEQDFSMTMKGNLPGMVNRVKKAWKEAERQGKLVVVNVKEAYTSKVCSKCFVRDMVSKAIDDFRLHPVLPYQGCNTVWYCVINVSRKIHDLALQEINENPRPEMFCRPELPLLSSTTD
ncbi:hypothetical protein BC941DRAFT_517242 [Chlamydoabsidia padenii]|nr:hypothetical protein BC941DRAFT_517242 [Chlamydoabsidia padenii]